VHRRWSARTGFNGGRLTKLFRPSMPSLTRQLGKCKPLRGEHLRLAKLRSLFILDNALVTKLTS